MEYGKKNSAGQQHSTTLLSVVVRQICQKGYVDVVVASAPKWSVVSLLNWPLMTKNSSVVRSGVPSLVVVKVIITNSDMSAPAPIEYVIRVACTSLTAI